MSVEIRCLPQEEGRGDFTSGVCFSNSSFCFTSVLDGWETRLAVWWGQEAGSWGEAGRDPLGPALDGKGHCL